MSYIFQTNAMLMIEFYGLHNSNKNTTFTGGVEASDFFLCLGPFVPPALIRVLYLRYNTLDTTQITELRKFRAESRILSHDLYSHST